MRKQRREANQRLSFCLYFLSGLALFCDCTAVHPPPLNTEYSLIYTLNTEYFLTLVLNTEYDLILNTLNTEYSLTLVLNTEYYLILKFIFMG